MPPPATFTSAAIVSATCLGSKVLVNAGTQSYKLQGREHLLRALGVVGPDGKHRTVEPAKPGEKPVRRGVLTVCNHNSVVDDPMMWTIMPTRTFMPFASRAHTCYNTRWTLGASDVMFTNPFLSSFFNAGQVIETVRGGGIYQAAVDTAIKRIEDGSWVHIFPEGRVNQDMFNPEGGLFRFKWGVGRIVMDSQVMPEIIPMWISGFDEAMNERRGWPRPVPRPGAHLSITVGEPITHLIEPLVAAHRAERGLASASSSTSPSLSPSSSGSDISKSSPRGASNPPGTRATHTAAQPTPQPPLTPAAYESERAHEADRATRIAITQAIQDAVARLGRGVEEAEGRFTPGQERWSQSVARKV